MYDIDERRQGMAVPRRGTARAALLALIASLLIAGCGGDDDPAPAPDPAPGPTEASITIGPAGGTLNGPDGVQVVIPPGALAQDTVIRVARTGAGAPAPIPEGVPTGATVYEFTPHDIDFAVPVTISAPAPATAGAQVFMASRNADWRAVGSTDSGSRLLWEVLGFSWALIADACAPRNNDPYPCTWPRTTAVLSATPPAALTRLTVGSSVPVYRVNQAATVDLRFTFSAARDCGSASVKITRWKRGVNNVSGRPVVTTLLDASFPTLQPDPQNASRSGGEVSVPLTFAEADNGVHYIGSSFSCLRPGQTQRSTFGGTVQINTEISPAPLAAPAIGQQPADQSVAAGAAATFAAIATGTPTPALQWQRSTDGGVTWVDIAGATNGSYTTPATVAGDSGQRFRMVATNGAGSAVTNGALLTVTVAPPPASAWTAPASVDTGNNGQPAAGVDGARNSLALWARTEGGRGRLAAARGSVSGAWQAPALIDAALPADASSYDPQLAVTSGGPAMAVWGYGVLGTVEFHVAAARFDGSAWSAAERIDALGGQASDFRVGMDGNGRAVAVYRQFNGSRRALYGRRHDGTSWSPAEVIDGGSNSGGVALAVDAQGRGWVAITAAGEVKVTAVDLVAGRFDPPVTLGSALSARDPRVAIDATGGAIVTWVAGAANGSDLMAARFAGGAWQTPELVDNIPAGQPDYGVAITGSGAATVAWVERDAGNIDSVFSRRFLPGSGWQSVERRSAPGAGSVSRVQVVANSAGRTVVNWVQDDSVSGNPTAWAQVLDGSWGPAVRVQGPSFRITSLFLPLGTRSLAIGPDGATLLLWTEDVASGNTPVTGAYFP